MASDALDMTAPAPDARGAKIAITKALKNADIVKELEKPGLDPRKSAKVFEFDPNVKTIKDVRSGMILPGIVNNITAFGCFVDIGVKESGLVHISQLKEGFVSDVNEVVKLHQHVQVKVVEADEDRKRIQLTMVL